MSSPPLFAVIGGSGLYDIPGLTQIREHWLNTPFGKPSGPIIQGEIHGEQVLFLARHGKGHPINPSQVNYRANIYGLKKLGVNRVISINACGSLREDFKPGDLVIPTQLFDFTKYRKNTFFEDGFAAHVGTADPFCPDLSDHLYQVLQEGEAAVHNHGMFITIEGPRFSTRLESNTFRSWGMDIIGMTSAPEAFLAREAEMCYAAIAHITDYDVWHSREEAVSVEIVLKIISRNTTNIKEAISALAISALPDKRSCGCLSALESALITNPEVISPKTRAKLGLLVSKYLEE